MDTLDEESTPNLLSLPAEILIHIFTYLRLKDRKNVRLTSRRCRDACNAFSIRKREKFYFCYRFVRGNEVTNFLLRSEYDRMDLEFKLFLNTRYLGYVWHVCGGNVHTLSFYQCRMSNAMLGNIITHCVNLVSFNFVYRSLYLGNDEVGDAFCSQDLLEDLIAKEVRRPKLIKFAWDFEGYNIPSWILKNIFLVFPGIKYFLVGPFEYKPSMRKSIIPRIDRYIHHFLAQESLRLNVLSDGGWIRTWNAQSNSESRLQKLETILIYSKDLEKTVLNFFSRQENLREIGLILINSTHEFFDKLKGHIRNRCTKIQTIILRNLNDVGSNKDLFLFENKLCLIEMKLYEKYYTLHCESLKENEPSPYNCSLTVPLES